MRRFLKLISLSVLILGLGGATSYWVYMTERDEVLSTSADEIGDAMTAFELAVERTFEPALAMGQAIAESGIRDVDIDARTDLFFALSTGLVRRYRQLNGVFIGFPDGRFLHAQDLSLLASAPDGHKETKPSTPSRENLLIGRVIDQPATNPAGIWRAYNAKTGDWRPYKSGSLAYDPRRRPWYIEAVKSGDALWTEPYIFASSGQLGVTYSKPLFDRSGHLWGVIGVDLSLRALSQTLLVTSSALTKVADYVFATDLAQKVIGHPDFTRFRATLGANTYEYLEKYRRKDSFESILADQFSDDEAIKVVSIKGVAYLAAKAELNSSAAMPLQIFLARKLDTILLNATNTMQRNVALVFIAIVILGVVTAYAVKLKVEMSARRRAETALIDARDIAEAATQAKSTFLATMSHEIRTPMNGVMSMAELLGLTRLDDEQRRMTKIITDSANALLTIINDILDFSKIESGKLDIETVEFSLMDVVNGAADLLLAKAEEKGLELIVDIDPTLVDRRTGDPTRLRQILLNLGGNAVKFTEAGVVRINVSRCESKAAHGLRFEVCDTGIGLTPAQKDKLFQAFVQADASTTRKYGGTGLGLSICQRLADLMGGRIGADSTFGEGSIFWCEFPMPAAGDVVPHPAFDIASASVRLVGLSAPVAEIATRYLSAGGVSDIIQIDSLNDAQDTTADLWIFTCASEDLTDDSLSRIDGAIVLTHHRDELSILSDALKSKVSTVLSLPLSSTDLWRATAIALGHETAVSLDLETRDDLAFSPPTIEAARAKNALVLVAEDNETNQIVICKILARMGYASEVAGNGKIALAMLEKPGYGLLLTDFNMPEMDGFELTRAIRRMELETDEKPVRLPIIALTADALSGTEDACLRAGMDAYLTKPIDSRKFGQTMAEFLPGALALRIIAVEEGPAPSETASIPDWDLEIFDPGVLADPSGIFDQEAKDLVDNAVESWVQKIQQINDSLASQNKKQARDIVHGLKGAALSIGANRLGAISSDIQDFIDDNDMEMATIMAEVLAPTLDELNKILPRIRQQ